MKFTLTAVVGLASLAPCAPIASVDNQSSLEKITDEYLFNISLDQFIHYRKEHTGPAELDWTSDGCSYSLDHPLGYDFKTSCQRHDFGYCNYKKQGRTSAVNRASIDKKFKKDMRSQCAKKWLKWPCKLMANMYYGAAKKFGGPWYKEDMGDMGDMEDMDMEDMDMETKV